MAKKLIKPITSAVGGLIGATFLGKKKMKAPQETDGPQITALTPNAQSDLRRRQPRRQQQQPSTLLGGDGSTLGG